MKRKLWACINCRRPRRCILIQAHIPVDDDWEEAARVPICFACLRDDTGALGHYLASEVRT